MDDRLKVRAKTENLPKRALPMLTQQLSERKFEFNLSVPQTPPGGGCVLPPQMHHRSTWDSDLMVKVLTELGFKDVRPVGFGIGSDQRLIRDDNDKERESLYVEARKS